MNSVPRLVFEVREIELSFEVNWRVVFPSTIDVQSCRSKRVDLWVGEDPFSKHISFGFFFFINLRHDIYLHYLQGIDNAPTDKMSRMDLNYVLTRRIAK